MSLIFFPYTVVQSNGDLVTSQAPTVDSLPLEPTSSLSVVLTADHGSAIAGIYQWIINGQGGQWRYMAPFAIFCDQLFSISSTFICFPTQGTSLLAVGASGTADLLVYRQGVQISNYTVGTTGLTLGTPASANDVYLVVQTSTMTPASAAVPEAPVVPGEPFVRVDGMWEDLQDFLIEGTFVG